jgi:O-antigen/teichoic acid export membrane protein
LLLGAQKVVSVVVTAAGGIALARLLTPEVFGLYAILIFVITLGVRFSELGLGAALIQRRDLDLATGLSAAFTATFALALVLGAAIMAAAPLVARWPGVSSEVTAPVRWLALLVVFSSLRMPAMVLLERRLAYLPLTIAETCRHRGVLWSWRSPPRSPAPASGASCWARSRRAPRTWRCSGPRRGGGRRSAGIVAS